MTDQITKARLIETLQASRATLDALLAEIPTQWMVEPGAAGDWSVKDVVAHLTYHDRWLADRLHEQLRGERYQPGELDFMEFDQRNERIYRQYRDLPLDQVLAESRSSFQRLLEGVHAHAEAFLIEPQTFEGAPGPVVVAEMLRSEVYDHYAAHLPSIRTWLAARRER